MTFSQTNAINAKVITHNTHTEKITIYVYIKKMPAVYLSCRRLSAGVPKNRRPFYYSGDCVAQLRHTLGDNEQQKKKNQLKWNCTAFGWRRCWLAYHGVGCYFVCAKINSLLIQCSYWERERMCVHAILGVRCGYFGFAINDI